MADEGAPSTGRPLLRQDAPAASVQAKAAIAEVEVTENGGVWLQAGVVGPPAPSEPQALTEDDVEVLLFAASGDTDPQASGVAADKAATPVSPVVERFVVAFENYRNHLSGASRFYPWAGVMEFFVANRILCPALHFLLLVLTSNPPSIGIVTAEKQPLNPDGTLPRPLKDLRGYEDMFVDEATLQAERNTYYYFYKMYDNLYAYALANKPSKTMLDPVAAGWYNQRVHFRNATHFGGTLRTSPFYVTVEKDGHVAVLLRGTMFRDEWEKDFMSRLTQPGETEPYFGGRVHAGTFRLFQEMVPHLMADLEARKPKHITLAGHSLGGGLSLMMGAYLGKLWDGEGPTVDVLTFGAYSPGDKAFWDCASKHMNVRNVKYLGEGWTEQDGDKMYTMGDMVAQAPGVPLPNCPRLSGGGSEDEVSEFYMLPSAVPFWPTSLRNTKEWRVRTDMLRPTQQSVVRNHKCAYTCWLTEGVGDPDNLCHFEEEQPTWWKTLLGQAQGPRLTPGEICTRTELDPSDFDLSLDARIRGRAGTPPGWGDARK